MSELQLIKGLDGDIFIIMAFKSMTTSPSQMHQHLWNQNHAWPCIYVAQFWMTLYLWCMMYTSFCIRLGDTHLHLESTDIFRHVCYIPQALPLDLGRLCTVEIAYRLTCAFANFCTCSWDGLCFYRHVSKLC